VVQRRRRLADIQESAGSIPAGITRRFAGQVIRDGQRMVYASLPTTRKWLADNKWQTAKPFVI
jgi:hypothetical protein